MRLAINASEVGRRRGGNESYIIGLISGLEKCTPHSDVTLLMNSWDHSAPIHTPFEQMNLGPYRPTRFWLMQQQRAVRKIGADWYLGNFFLPPDMPCKGAVIVHDMSFCAHPEYFPRHIALYMQWLTRWSVQKADVVITISDFTKSEIERFWHIDPEKVVVIHNGIGDDFHAALDSPDTISDQKVLEKYGVTVPYILTVGNIHPRKNLGLLLDAYIALRDKGFEVPHLVWGGVQRWQVSDLIRRAEQAGVILTGYIDQADLPVFYRQTRAFVYPSLYEGFGLPPVEAMACGAPVITSSTSSMPEVVGDAAVLIDPTSVEAMIQALERVLGDADLRSTLRTAGIQQAAQYKWERTAQSLVNTLENRG